MVEGTRLLIWRTGNGTEGSNPSLSASQSRLSRCFARIGEKARTYGLIRVLAAPEKVPSPNLRAIDSQSLCWQVGRFHSCPRHGRINSLRLSQG